MESLLTYLILLLPAGLGLIGFGYISMGHSIAGWIFIGVAILPLLIILLFGALYRIFM